MREKWKALTKRERLRLRRRSFSSRWRCCCASFRDCAFPPSSACVPRRCCSCFSCWSAPHGAAAARQYGAGRVLLALLAAGFVLFAALETMVIRGSLAEKTDAPVSAVIVLGAGRERRNALALAAHAHRRGGGISCETPRCAGDPLRRTGARARPSPKRSVCAARWSAAAWTRRGCSWRNDRPARRKIYAFPGKCLKGWASI